jgi:hypothetical protein
MPLYVQRIIGPEDSLKTTLGSLQYCSYYLYNYYCLLRD